MTISNPRERKVSRKKGSKRNEPAVKHGKAEKNFKQSRDIREDRGTMQSKMNRPHL